MRVSLFMCYTICQTQSDYTILDKKLINKYTCLYLSVVKSNLKMRSHCWVRHCFQRYIQEHFGTTVVLLCSECITWGSNQFILEPNHILSSYGNSKQSQTGIQDTLSQFSGVAQAWDFPSVYSKLSDLTFSTYFWLFLCTEMCHQFKSWFDGDFVWWPVPQILSLTSVLSIFVLTVHFRITVAKQPHVISGTNDHVRHNLFLTTKAHWMIVGFYAFTFTFSHLADAFVQSDVQGREQSS